MYLGDKKSDIAVASRNGGADQSASAGMDSNDLKSLLASKPYAVAKGAVGGNIQTSVLITRNLPNILKLACLISPDNGVLHVDEHGRETLQTNADIMAEARCVLAGLRDKGMKPGDKVVLQVDDQPTFLAAFWGATLGGFVTVPLPIPGGLPAGEGMERVTKVCGILDRYCIVTDLAKENYALLDTDNVFSFSELAAYPPDKKIHRPKSKDTAILLFSSGSTGDPKGVMLSHKNIVCEIETGSMSFSNVPAGDYRTAMMGFPLYIVRRTLFKNKEAGPVSRLVGRLAASGFGKFLAGTKPGKYFLDTLEILCGRIISVNLRMTWNDIILANWMPYSHVMGLIGLHIAPTALAFTQVALKTSVFSENPALLLKLVDRYRISYLPLPNFAVQWLTTQVAEADIQGIDLSCIKMLGNAAEPISPDVTRKFIEKFSKFGLKPECMTCAYGMSEASAEITFPPLHEDPVFIKVDRDLLFREKIALPTAQDQDGVELTELGPPVQCLELRVVDDNDTLVKENVVGHVQLKGPTVVEGYYNNPGANENLFCDGWLRTGDMGFMINGRLVLTGRQKDIIFVNGRNLYANDIEQRIKQIPGMEFMDFAISGLKDYGSDSEKVILFVNRDESNEAMAALMARINRELISGMGIRIDYLVPVDDIPRTPTAKVKRFKLREKFENSEFTNVITLDDAAAWAETIKARKADPLNPTEEALARIWQAVTEKEDISRYDNFFDLGGNSLMATRITSRVREEMGVDIPLRTIFEHQTLESFAAAVETMKAYAGSRQFPPIEPLPREDYYEVSHAQKRLWYLDQVIPNSVFFNIPGAVMIENMTFDPGVLKDAFQAVIQRHESLRTTFRTVDNQPMQKIADHMDAPVRFIDLESDNAQDDKLAIIIEQEKNTPFRLETGPLLRATVVKLSETRHAFIIIQHHIISDGWSMGLLVREVMQNYFAFLAGNPTPFPELRVQYKDFAYWQNRVIQSPEMKEQENYWKEALSGSLPVLDLPTDRPRPSEQTHNADSERLELDKDFSAQIRDLAKTLGVTPFMLTLALFKVLLHKMTGQDDIIVGSPIANRTSQDIEPLIGFFVNMLPLRSFPDGNPVFRDFLNDIKQTALSGYAHQDFPFDKLVEVINPVRDMSRSPVFDVVFEYRDLYLDAFTNFNMDVDNVSVRDITGDDPIAKYDILATLSQGAETTLMQFDYNRDLFDRSTIRRFMGYFVTLIKEAIQDPDKRLSGMIMLTPPEKEQILTQFNDTYTKVGYPAKTIHELFQEQVEKTPDNIAVTFEGDGITYRELNQKANQLANLLRRKGVNRESIVGLMTDKSLEMIVSIIGILKSGGAYLPIDPDYPEERIRYMLDDSGTELLLTTTALEPKAGFKKDIVYLDKDETRQGEDTNPAVVNQPSDLAYIIYTSGTTGKPKGTMIEHVNVVRLMVNDRNLYDFHDKDVWTMFHSVCFDFSVWEMYGALLFGGRLVVIPKSTAIDPKNYLAVLKQEKVTVLNQTPSAFYNLIEEELKSPDRDLVIRYVIFGGEALKPVKLKEWKRKYPETQLINMYGITETTVHVTFKRITDREISTNISNIGTPIPTLSTYVMDEFRNLLPIGIPGELCVGGDGVGRGYLNRPELTAERFIANPYKPDERLYRSGDLVKFLENGEMEYLGRIDHQVKIRGFRIELGEIETRLLMREDISEAVVLAKESPGGNSYLCAYYVPGITGGDVTVSEFRKYLARTLPDYMIPSHFIAMDRIPLTHNGKVDRRALPDPEGVRPDMAGDYAAPSNELETLLAKIWQDVLSVDKVGIHDNFFDLGGDSIISLQIVTKLGQHGYSLHPKDILQHQTISELSLVVEKASGVDAEQGPVVGTAPLTPIQKWFFSQDLSNENQFNQALLFKSGLRIEADALETALKALTAHHDVLRATFADGKQEFQPVTDNVLFTVKKVDTPEDLDTAVRTLQASFDISKGPVFGIGLFQMNENDYLLLAGHHLAVDGVSWRILTEDLLSSYNAALGNTEVLLPPKTTSYKEWAAALDAYAEIPELNDEIAFWEKMLDKDIPPVAADHDNGPDTYGSADTVSRELDRETTDQLLKEIHSAYNTDVNDILLTALMQAQTEWTGQDHAMFSLEGHGREDVIENVDISRTVGWFTTIYPVVLSPERNNDPGSHIKYVKETLRAVPHKGFNYGVLKYGGRLMPRTEPEITFNYLGQVVMKEMGGLFSLDRTNAPGITDDTNTRHSLIDINCIVIDGCLTMDFQFSANRFRRQSIESFADMFMEKLSVLIRFCLDPDHFDITPSDFDLVDLDQNVLDNLMDFD